MRAAAVRKQGRARKMPPPDEQTDKQDKSMLSYHGKPSMVAVRTSRSRGFHQLGWDLRIAG